MRQSFKYIIVSANVLKIKNPNPKIRVCGERRGVKQYHPWYEEKSCPKNNAFTDYSSSNFSEVHFDELDRAILLVDPEQNHTVTAFSIEADISGRLAHKTTVTVENDSNPTISSTFNDITGKTISSKNVLNGSSGMQELWTTFNYSVAKELLSYTDADGLTTTYEYDLAGRKTKMKHPDNGQRMYVYDVAGNLKNIFTSNLLADNTLVNPSINFIYEYNRLKEIKYPDTPQGGNISNVLYKYYDVGTLNAGRLSVQRDATGTQTYEYDQMGNMVHNNRVIVGPNIPTRTFDTYFTYDSWGRIRDITYPDGENVTYSYDFGGNLNKISGFVADGSYDYLKQRDYDHFEQLTLDKYGNGTETHYEYSEGLRRLMHLEGKESSGNYFMNSTYAYDKIGNIINHNTGDLPIMVWAEVLKCIILMIT